MGIASNRTKNLQYLEWLRYFACCKHGGINPDASGRGIKPFAVNEMSMLAYYHEIAPKEMMLFPVVPQFNYNLNKWVTNMSEYAPYGREAGPNTGKKLFAL